MLPHLPIVRVLRFEQLRFEASQRCQRCSPVSWALVLSEMDLVGLLSVVVKAVYMQMMLQCLLVWMAFVRYRLAVPSQIIGRETSISVLRNLIFIQ